MKILAINGTYRAKGTTTQLTEKALAGAISEGADTEMIMLTEKNVKFCTNCLACYKDTTSDIAPCTIKDDMQEILQKIKEADGVIFSSPVHCGFVTALMNAFGERGTWTLFKPTGELMGLKGMPEPRLTDKARATATIVSAGGVPPELREHCDTATPWLKELAVGFCNGECVGDIYAGANYNKELEGDEWNQAYFYRELTEEQLQEAYDLGVKMAKVIKSGDVRPYDPSMLT